MGDAASDAAPGAAEALVPAESWTDDDSLLNVELAPAEQTPFRDDDLLFFEGGLIRNELAVAQGNPEAARDLAARHWSRLLYDPNAPWRGRTPYPQVSQSKLDK